MGREKADGGFVLYSEVDSEQRPRFLFFRSGDGVGRFHQRAKGVAADFSERGGGRERLRLPRKIWAETGDRIVDGQGKRERESDVTEKKRDGWTNGEKGRHRERERERKGKKKDIASRWTRRLAFTVSEASLAANGERGFRPCVEGRWESGVERERESSYRAWSVNLNGKYKK